MKALPNSIVVLVLLLSCWKCDGQISETDQIIQADRLRLAGEPRRSIAILESLTLSATTSLREMDLGAVWDLLGLAYQDIERYRNAEHAYEIAIRIFQPLTEGRASMPPRLTTLEPLKP